MAQKTRKKGSTGDKVMLALSLLAAVLAILALVGIGYQVVTGSKMAFNSFGLGFITDPVWNPNAGADKEGVYGAWVPLVGTLITASFALLIALPVGVVIGLYLSELAPGPVAKVVGPLVEMLAAVPSVVVGFWGLIVLAPWSAKHLEPFLHETLGFIPLFGEPQASGSSTFTACLILSLMILPIIGSLSRDLFLTVPREMKDGAEALGATHWEIVRGVDLPSCAAGIAAASLLALGRALGEAIAVAQVIGGGNAVQTSLFLPGDTLAARLASQFPGAVSDLHVSALFYLGVLLLVIGMAANLTAIWIANRFDVERKMA
ncbi:MAG: phosphate ABC transporter permease subunit PstC [Solirubrobacterales bacterium]